MKIGLVILHANSTRGGAERYTIDLAAGLSHRGHDTHLLAGSFGGDLPWEVRQEELSASGMTRALRYNTFLKSLDEHLQSNNYDVIHAMLPVNWCDLYHPHAGLAADAIARGHLKHRGIAQPFAKFFNQFNLRRRRFAKVEKQLLERRNPPLVACLSDYVKATVREFYTIREEDLVTLFNGIDLRRFDPADRAAPRKEKRKELGIADDRVVALMVAQDFARKGLRETIYALSKATDQRLMLIVVGKDNAGPYRRLARSLKVQNRVLFAGATDDPYPYYAAADFFVLPTKHDPCSLVVLEALAMGLPVISTKMNGATEIMTDGVDGYVLDDPTRVDALASAMTKMLDARRRMTLSDAARGLRSKLSFDQHINDLLRIYQTTMTRRLRGGPTT